MKKLFSPAVKKIICVLLVLALVFLCSCGKTETVKTEKKRVLKNRFTEMPCYALSEDATTDEMRQMAVKAFRDQITVPWYVDEDINYRKSGAGGNLVFRIKSSHNYGGMPYTNGTTTLFHWLQFYDFETGKISLSENDIARNYGNTCSTGVMAALTAVCASVSSEGTAQYVPRTGFYPVGDYDCDTVSLNTGNICERNGMETMFRAYAKVKPADTLVYNIFTDEEASYPGHIIMATESAHVEYNDDGSINGRNSYITMQDQHMGITKRTAPFYVYENGMFMHYSGHRNSKMTFAGLYNASYIPVTAGEFIGKAKYQKSFLNLDMDSGNSYSSLEKGILRSNYSIITVCADIYDGKKKIASEKLVTGTGDYYRARIGSIKLSRVLKSEALKSRLTSGKKYRIVISSLVGTGETLTAFDGSITY